METLLKCFSEHLNILVFLMNYIFDIIINDRFIYIRGQNITNEKNNIRN